MDQAVFFDTIESHYQSGLPFASYRKPNKVELKAFLQKTDQLFHATTFEETGFVFSPFDASAHTVIFPTEQSDIITTTFSSELPENDEENHVDVPKKSQQSSHINLVEQGIVAIHQTTLEKVVLSRVEELSQPSVSPVSVFKKLLGRYSAAMVYIWYHPKVGLWLGATPETLIAVEGSQFSTMSLAGTQAVRSDGDATWDTKNKEEQQVVTNFIIDQLQPYVKSIKVSEPRTVRAGQLWHLQSLVSGTLKTGCLKDLILAMHPTPAVCGLPKEKAKTFILDHESYDREFYTGFFGELNIKNAKSRNRNRRNVENNAYTAIKTSSHLFVNLRCMQFKDAQAYIYVGGGITKDSNPEQEWHETVNKAKTMMSVLLN